MLTAILPVLLVLVSEFCNNEHFVVIAVYIIFLSVVIYIYCHVLSFTWFIKTSLLAVQLNERWLLCGSNIIYSSFSK